MTARHAQAVEQVIAEFEHSAIVLLRGSDEPRLELSRSTTQRLAATVSAAGLRAIRHPDPAFSEAVSALAQFVAPLVDQRGDHDAASGPILAPQAVARLTRLCQVALTQVRRQAPHLLSDAIVQLVNCLEPVLSMYRREARIYLASRMPTHLDTETALREVDAAIDGLRELSATDDPSRI